jgi:hypothetical protein
MKRNRLKKLIIALTMASLVGKALPSTAAPALQGATICANAFEDDNGNGIHDSDEGQLAGVTLVIASSEQVVMRAVSSGSGDPVCADELAPGRYQVVQIVPGNLEMTTAANAQLQVDDGEAYGVEFGSRNLPGDRGADPDSPNVPVAIPTPVGDESGAKEADTTSEASEGIDLLALSGLLVMSLGVVLLGVLIFLVLQRQSRS